MSEASELIDTSGEPLKESYTEDENYRAYKLFSMMDVDGGGSISLRELFRVLMGDVERNVACTFEHPDSGIIWGLDDEQCVVIADIEEASLAQNFPFLIQNMRLFSIQDVEIPQYDEKALEMVYRELLRLIDDPCTMEFREPLLIINKFSCILDIEVDGEIYSITLPIGAVYNLNLFKKRVMKAMAHVDPRLSHIKVDFVERKRQMFFKCRKYHFRLMFGTGPNYRRSCRYALGFNADDTPYSDYHIGQPMLIDLNLGLDEEKTEILMVELFHKFDRDNSGEFEFEEFRDFYIKYLDTEDSLESLKKYAIHRFRDIEFEKYVRNKQLEREQKLLRRAYLKEKYKDVVAAQYERFMANSHVDKFGNRRRKYRHREVKRKKESVGDDELRRMVNAGALQDALQGIPGMVDEEDGSVKSGAVVRAAQAVLQSGESFLTDLSTEEEHMSLKEAAQAAARRKHESMKRKVETRKERMKLRRQIILKKIAEANKALHQQEKIDAKKQEEGKNSAVMHEAHFAIKKALIKSMRMSSTDMEHVANMTIDPLAGAASPALIIEPGIFNSSVNFEDIRLIELGPKKMNPGAMQYFFVRKPDKVRKEFNSEVKHPAFFTADFERERSRHSRLALGICRLLSYERQAGIDYRSEHGVTRCTSIPPEEEFIARRDRKKPRVKFLEPTKSITPKSLVARLTVRSIRVTHLPSIHFMQPNSPFVRITCGDWKFVTEVNSYAGSESTWDDLLWMFRVHAGDVLAAEVFSGSPSSSELIGAYSISGLQLAKQPVDSQNGNLHLSGKLIDEDSENGRIDFDLFVELGDEWDWFVFHYKRNQAASRKMRKEQKRFSRTLRSKAALANGGPLSTPFTVEIISIAAFDLKAVHLFGKNRPYVTMNCGYKNFATRTVSAVEAAAAASDSGMDASSTADVAHTNSASPCDWSGLSWRLTIYGEENNLIFLAMSGQKRIGRFVITGKELAAIQYNNSDGSAEVFGDFREQKEFTGKLRIRLKLVESSKPPAEVEISSPTGVSLNASPIGTNYSWISDHDVNEEKTTHDAGGVRFPTLARLHTLELRMLSSAQLLGSHPNALISCGDWSMTTDPNKKSDAEYTSGGHMSRWQNMDATFPMHEESIVTITVLNNLKEIGRASVRAADTMNVQRNSDGIQTFTVDVINGINICGKLIVQFSYEHEGQVYTLAKLARTMPRSPSRAPILSVYSQMPAGSTSASDAHKFDTLGSPSRSRVLSTTLPRGEGENFPSRVLFTDIILTDLQSSHFLIKNSPSVSIACGNNAASTKEIPSAGPTAVWSGLDISLVLLDASSSVRLAVWSRGSVFIGSHTLDMQSLFAYTPDLHGTREAFFTIRSEAGKISGKMKVRFVIDSHIHQSVPQSVVDPTTIRMGLEPPIRVNIHMISTINLRPVHRFQRNSPVVKGFSAGWRGATIIQDGAGKDAKWENVAWSLVFPKNESTLRIVVQSGTIIIGERKITLAEFISHNPDRDGNCEMEHPLRLQSSDEVVGLIRITYGYEVEVDEVSDSDSSGTSLNQPHSDSDSDSSSRQHKSRNEIEDMQLVGTSLESAGLVKNSSKKAWDLRIGTSPGGDGVVSMMVNSSDEAVTVMPSADIKALVTIHFISLFNLRPAHTFMRNSPFVKIQCDKFRAMTSTARLAGSAASWFDMTTTFPMTKQSLLIITAMSGQATLGSCTFRLRDLMKFEKNNLEQRAISSDLLLDNAKVGHTELNVTINRSVTESRSIIEALLAKTNAKRKIGELGVDEEKGETEQPAEKRIYTASSTSSRERFTMSLNTARSVKELPPHWGLSRMDNNIRSPTAIPFTLRILRVTVFDLDPVVQRFFHSNAVNILQVTSEEWTKATPNTIIQNSTSGRQHSSWAIWEDPDWVFMVTNPRTLFQMVVINDVAAVGYFNVAISDVINTPATADGRVELVALIKKKNVTIGKVKVLFHVAPYVSPQEEAEFSSTPATTAAKGRLLGYLRIKSIHTANLHQVYGIFPNSPQVMLKLGHWQMTTNVALGGNGTDAKWENLQWGRIEIREGDVLTARVVSGNELIGIFALSVPDLLLSLEDAENIVVIAGEILDGTIPKGRIEIECIPVIEDVDSSDEEAAKSMGDVSEWKPEVENISPSEVDSKDVAQDSGNRPVSQRSVRFQGIDTDVEPTSSRRGSSRRSLRSTGAINISQRRLSDSTPTPSRTTVTVLGLSVYNLRSVSDVFRNSPMAVLSCDDWRNSTNVATFSGSSANWVFKKSSNWNFQMLGQTFIKLVIYSGGVEIGSTCLSTRDLMAITPNGQGLTSVVRPIQKDLKTGGNVRLLLHLTAHYEQMDPIGSKQQEGAADGQLPTDDDDDSMSGKIDMERQPIAAGDYSLLFTPEERERVSVKAKVRTSDYQTRNRSVMSVVPTGDFNVAEALVVTNKTSDLNVPFTINISRITCLEMNALSAMESSSSLTISSGNLIVSATSGEWRQSTGPFHQSGRYAEWEDLDWSVNFMRPSDRVTVRVKSSMGQSSDKLSFTAVELLSMPRTSQGFVEIYRNIRQNGSSVGKIVIGVMLYPYYTDEEKAALLRHADSIADLKSKYARRLATVQIDLISAIDISPLHARLCLTLNNTGASKEQEPLQDVYASNQRGTAVWGNLQEKWSAIDLRERAIFTFSVKSDEGTGLGKMVITAAEIIATPADPQGYVVVYGALLDGLVHRGKLSIACRVKFEQLPDGTAAVEDALQIDKSNKLIQEFVREVPMSSITSISLMTASVCELKAVHKVGKNSPLLKMEYRGLKFQTTSRPYSGKKAEWTDLMWELSLKPSAKIKISVSSGSVLIGNATFAMKKLLDQYEISQETVTLTVDLLNLKEVTGKAVLLFKFNATEEVATVSRTKVDALVGANPSIDSTRLPSAILPNQEFEQPDICGEESMDGASASTPILNFDNHARASSSVDASLYSRGTPLKTDFESIVHDDRSHVSELTAPAEVIVETISRDIVHTDDRISSPNITESERPKTSRSRPTTPDSAKGELFTGLVPPDHDAPSSSRASINDTESSGEVITRASESRSAKSPNMASTSFDTAFESSTRQSLMSSSCRKSSSATDDVSFYSHSAGSVNSVSYEGTGSFDDASYTTGTGIGTGSYTDSVKGSVSLAGSDSYDESASYSIGTVTERRSNSSAPEGTSYSGSKSSPYSSSNVYTSAGISMSTSRYSHGSDSSTASTALSTSHREVGSQSIHIARSNTSQPDENSNFNGNAENVQRLSTLPENEDVVLLSAPVPKLEGSAFLPEVQKEASSIAYQSIYSGYEDAGGGRAAVVLTRSNSGFSEYSATSTVYSTPRTDRSGVSEYSSVGSEYTDRWSDYSESSASSSYVSGSYTSRTSSCVESARSETNSSDFQQLQTQPLNESKEFDVSSLRFEVNRNDCVPHFRSLQHAAQFTARQFVNDALSAVISSFIAMEMKEDFGVRSAQPHLCLGGMKDAGTIEDFSVTLVRNVVNEAATMVWRRLVLAILMKEQRANPLLDGTFVKRAGITLTAESLKASFARGDDAQSDMTSDPGSARPHPSAGFFTGPQKARITFLDIIGIDLSCLDPRVLPRRPYLTCCKPYGNWAAETSIGWTNLNKLQPQDLILNWYDLCGRWKWDRFVLRIGQILIFDLHDAGSGLVVAKSKLRYETIMEKHMSTGNEEVAVYIEFDIANEYGGGKVGGVIRVHLDLSVNIYVRPPKTAEYWNKHRIHHWKNFPLTPISAGIVRQRYREIANEYDRQMIVHPCFFGFRARWTGNQENESRFIHPMFQGFTLAKKPMEKKAAAMHHQVAQKSSTPNPYRWDPMAASRGECPVCADGVSGCPRCFMMPVHANGLAATPDEFGFNPDVERAKKREAEQKLIAISAKRQRRLSNLKISVETGELEEGSVGSYSELSESIHSDYTMELEQFQSNSDNKVNLHTNLTTYKSIRGFRNVAQRLLSIFVKVFPSGHIRKLVMDPTDTTFRLYHMFNSHSDLGNSHSPMLLLPSMAGFFEIHAELAAETDLLLADKRGRDTLADYGFHERRGVVVLLYMQNYKPEYVNKLLQNYFSKQTLFKAPQLPTYNYNRKIPDSLVNDTVQKYLRGLVEIEYNLQQKDILADDAKRGLSYRQSRAAAVEASTKKRAAERKERERERQLEKQRLESQLKGLTGAKRKAKKAILKKRELDKKRTVLFSSEKEQVAFQKQREILASRGGKLSPITPSAGVADDDASVASRLSLGDVHLSEVDESIATSRSSATSDSDDSSLDDEEEDSDGEDSSGESSSSESSSSGNEDASEQKVLNQDLEVRLPEKIQDDADEAGILFEQPAHADAEVASARSSQRFYVIGSAAQSVTTQETASSSAVYSTGSVTDAYSSNQSTVTGEETLYTSRSASTTSDGSTILSVSQSLSSQQSTLFDSSVASDDLTRSGYEASTVASTHHPPLYHSAASLNSLYSGYEKESTKDSSVSQSIPSLYSALEASTRLSLEAMASDGSTICSGDSSLLSEVSAAQSNSTGGLFTYRSALNSSRASSQDGAHTVRSDLSDDSYFFRQQHDQTPEAASVFSRYMSAVGEQGSSRSTSSQSSRSTASSTESYMLTDGSSTSRSDISEYYNSLAASSQSSVGILSSRSDISRSSQPDQASSSIGFGTFTDGGSYTVDSAVDTSLKGSRSDLSYAYSSASGTDSHSRRRSNATSSARSIAPDSSAASSTDQIIIKTDIISGRAKAKRGVAEMSYIPSSTMQGKGLGYLSDADESTIFDSCASSRTSRSDSSTYSSRTNDSGSSMASSRVYSDFSSVDGESLNVSSINSNTSYTTAFSRPQGQSTVPSMASAARSLSSYESSISKSSVESVGSVSRTLREQILIARRANQKSSGFAGMGEISRQEGDDSSAGIAEPSHYADGARYRLKQKEKDLSEVEVPQEVTPTKASRRAIEVMHQPLTMQDDVDENEVDAMWKLQRLVHEIDGSSIPTGDHSLVLESVQSNDAMSQSSQPSTTATHSSAMDILSASSGTMTKSTDEIGSFHDESTFRSSVDDDSASSATYDDSFSSSAWSNSYSTFSTSVSSSTLTPPPQITAYQEVHSNVQPKSGGIQALTRSTKPISLLSAATAASSGVAVINNATISKVLHSISPYSSEPSMSPRSIGSGSSLKSGAAESVSHLTLDSYDEQSSAESTAADSISNTSSHISASLSRSSYVTANDGDDSSVTTSSSSVFPDFHSNRGSSALSSSRSTYACTQESGSGASISMTNSDLKHDYEPVRLTEVARKMQEQQGSNATKNVDFNALIDSLSPRSGERLLRAMHPSVAVHPESTVDTVITRSEYSTASIDRTSATGSVSLKTRSTDSHTFDSATSPYSGSTYESMTDESSQGEMSCITNDSAGQQSTHAGSSHYLESSFSDYSSNDARSTFASESATGSGLEATQASSEDNDVRIAPMRLTDAAVLGGGRQSGVEGRSSKDVDFNALIDSLSPRSAERRLVAAREGMAPSGAASFGSEGVGHAAGSQTDSSTKVVDENVNNDDESRSTVISSRKDISSIVSSTSHSEQSGTTLPSTKRSSSNASSTYASESAPGSGLEATQASSEDNDVRIAPMRLTDAAALGGGRQSGVEGRSSKDVDFNALIDSLSPRSAERRMQSSSAAVAIYPEIITVSDEDRFGTRKTERRASKSHPPRPSSHSSVGSIESSSTTDSSHLLGSHVLQDSVDASNDTSVGSRNGQSISSGQSPLLSFSDSSQSSSRHRVPRINSSASYSSSGDSSIGFISSVDSRDTSMLTDRTFGSLTAATSIATEGVDPFDPDHHGSGEVIERDSIHVSSSLGRVEDTAHTSTLFGSDDDSSSGTIDYLYRGGENDSLASDASRSVSSRSAEEDVAVDDEGHSRLQRNRSSSSSARLFTDFSS